MKTFLRMEVEQRGKTIKLRLDYCIQQVLADDMINIKNMLCPKKVPI
jgi:hypothetical protein